MAMDTLNSMYSAAPLLLHARLDAGLTQVELARRAGTSQAAISAAERGVHDVTVEKAQRILRATGRELTVRPTTPAVDPSDLELMRLNLTRSPEARLAGFFNLLQLRGLAVR